MERRWKWYFAALMGCLLATASLVGAQENVTIELGGPIPDSDVDFLNPLIATAERLWVRQDESGSTVTVIPGDHIREQNAVLVESSLREVPGVVFGATGPIGYGPRSLFLRGGESDHTLVLIDGHKVNQAGGAFDWDSIVAENIERIEVWRGAGSALYGSDALAGVINIITREGAGPPTVTVSMEAGSEQFARTRMGLTGAQDGLKYSFHLSRVQISDPEIDPNLEFENVTTSSRVTYEPTKQTQVDLTMRYFQEETGDPSTWTSPYGDPNNSQEEESLLLGLQLKYDHDAMHETILRYTFLDEERNNIDRDDVTGAATAFGFEALLTRSQANVQHNATFGSRLHQHTLSAGLEFEEETSDGTNGRYARDNLGYFLQERYSRGQHTHLTISGRLEDNSEYGQDVTFRVAVAQQLGDGPFSLKASAGKGIREPSFVELLDAPPFWDGNPDLVPEASMTFDLGLVYKDIPSMRVAGTLFQTHISDMIVFEDSSGAFASDGIPDYRNAGKAETRGLELEVVSKLHRRASLRAALTLLETEVLDDNDNPTVTFEEGKPLTRRPKIAGSLALRYVPLEDVSLRFAAYYVGERDDVDYNFTTRVRNDDYIRVDLSAGWRINGNWRAFMRVQNLFDKDYEEVYGFLSNGILAFAGVEYRQSF